MIIRIQKGPYTNKMRSIIPVLLAVVMVVSLAGVLFIGAAGQASAQGPSASMYDHAPIVVHNNTDLADMIALNDWPGSGTSVDPYRISGVDINATGVSNAISIGNTSSYLIIANSHLTNASFVSLGFGEGSGIFLFNVSNVLIENNTISECHYGIKLRNSSGVMVYDNVISHCSSYGLVSNGSSFDRFYLNAFVGNNGAGSSYAVNHAQAYDDRSDNQWLSGSLGNYWSDLQSTDIDHNSVLDSPYLLAGPSNVTDACPLAGLVASPYGIHAIVGQGSVSLSWTGSNYSIGASVTGLTLHRISTTGDSTTIALGPDALAYVDSGLHFLSDYTYYLVAHAGTDSAAGPSVTVHTDDLYPPTVSVLTPSAGAYLNHSSVVVTWNEGDNGSGVAYCLVRIDGDAWQNASSLTQWTAGGFDDGVHTVKLKVFDLAGNNATTSITFNVDTVVPTLTITSPNAGSKVNTSSVTVAATGEDVSGILGYQYKLDSGEWSELTASPSMNYLSLDQGSHTVYVKVFDRAGNNASGSVAFTLDTIAPELTILSPSEGAFLNSSSVTVTCSGDDINGILGYQYKLDNGEWSEITVSSSINYPFLDQGSHTVYVKEFDSYGNNATADVNFTVDTVVPSLIISSPSGGRWMNSSSVTVSSVGEDVSGILGYEFKLDTGEWSEMTTSSSINYPSLDQGSHIVYVKVFDRAGNNVTDAVTFNVDTVVPTLIITSPSADSLLNTSFVDVSCLGDDVYGILGYQYRLDNGEWSELTDSTSINYPSLDQGVHTVYIKVFDLAGNNATDSVSFTVDTVVPSLIISSPTEGRWSNSSSVTISCVGNDVSGIFGYQYKLDDGMWSAIANSSSINYHSLDQGSHIVYVKVFDRAGNNVTESVAFNVDTAAPTVTIDAPPAGSWSNVTSVTVSCTGDDVYGILGYQYKLDDGVWSGMTLSPSMNYTSLSQGSHTVYVRIFDLANNSFSSSVSFQVDSIAPSVSISSPAQAFLSDQDQVTFIWSGSDATSGLTGYRYRLDDNAWSSTSFGTDLTLSSISDGNHVLGIQAFDLAGNVKNVSVSFTVDTTPPIATIIAPSEDADLNTSSVTVNVNATDVSSAVKGIQFRVDGQAWTTMGLATSHQFTSLAEGMHIVEVQLFDNADNVRLISRNFTVDTLAPSIAITSPTGVIYSSVTSMRVNWTGSDLNSGLDGFQCRLDNGQWSATNGSLSNLFVGLTDGVHVVYVRALDNSRNMAVVSVSFTVDTAAPYLTITAPSEGNLTKSQSMTVSWDGADNTSGLQGFRFRLDGAGWSALSMTKTYNFVGLARRQASGRRHSHRPFEQHRHRQRELHR